MTENIYYDKHHVSHEPRIIRSIPHHEHLKIHHNIPIKNELNLKMRQYEKLVQVSVALKNWLRAYKRDFDENPIEIPLGNLEKKKKQILKEILVLIRDDLKKVKHIKGVGVRYLAGLLAYAHPERFSNLHKFLHYCGRKGSSRISKKYNHKVSSLVHQMTTEAVIHKDQKYYPLYKKIKEDLKTKHPTYSKIKIHSMALNRIGTFLLKEIYSLFKYGGKSHG